MPYARQEDAKVKDAQKFLFLVCSERSGSNFITSLMNGHSAICGPPPTHLFRLFGTNMDRYGDLQRDENWAQLLDDVTATFSTMLGSWTWSIDRDCLEKSVQERNVAALLSFIYCSEADLDMAQYVFVKENQTPTFAPFLLAHFSGCRFLFLVRDPRDVALSWKNTPTIPGGIARAVDTWLSDQESALSLYSQIKGSYRGWLIRYEDILDSPETSLAEVLHWAGLEFEPPMLNFHNHPRTQINAKKISAWGNLRAGILQDNHSKYKNQLSTVEIQYIEMRCHELMTVFGYDTEMSPSDTAENLSSEIAEIENTLEEPEYTLSQQESLIRERRLEGIRQILKRPRSCLIEHKQE